MKKNRVKNHPYVNVGGTAVLPKEDILGVFDLDTANTKTDTKRYLASMEQIKRLDIVGNDIPKSFVVTANGRKSKVFMTTLSAST